MIYFRRRQGDGLSICGLCLRKPKAIDADLDEIVSLKAMGGNLSVIDLQTVPAPPVVWQVIFALSAQPPVETVPAGVCTPVVSTVVPPTFTRIWSVSGMTAVL